MIILDTDAAVAMTLQTETGVALESMICEGEEVLAPSMFFAELTNTFSKYVRGGYLSNEEGVKFENAALSLVDEFVDFSLLWEEALAESVRLKHPAYDMFYLVLARRRAATLITLDQKLQELCLECGVNCLYTVTDF